MAINYEKKGQIAIVTMNRPEAMNCLNLEDMKELGRVWLDFKADENLRVAILTGAGEKSFSAGADLVSLVPQFTSGEMHLTAINPTFLKGVECFKPVVAAVNGLCLAAGTEILQYTDIRVAVEEAWFSVSEVVWGLFPAGGSSVNLPRQIPYCWAMELLLIGDKISAEQALKIGLINRVVPRAKLMSTAMDFAERLAANSPVAVRAIKESALRSFDLPIPHAYYLETYLASQVFASEDAKEGAMAFKEKRKPNFKGKKPKSIW